MPKKTYVAVVSLERTVLDIYGPFTNEIEAEQWEEEFSKLTDHHYSTMIYALLGTSLKKAVEKRPPTPTRGFTDTELYEREEDYPAGTRIIPKDTIDYYD